MTSLPYPAPIQRAAEDDSLTVRLRGLSPEQLLEAMQFLAWWTALIVMRRGSFFSHLASGPWRTAHQRPMDDSQTCQPGKSASMRAFVACAAAGSGLLMPRW